MNSTEADEQAVLAALERRRNRVNDAIAEDLPVEEPERLYDASRYLLDAGGKRLRPAMVLLVGEALVDQDPDDLDYRSFPTLDGERVDLLKAAVSIEIIQSFTLIHDDIMDDDEMRRGVPAVHKAFDLETAILAGDTLYSKSFEEMLATGAKTHRSLEALRLLAETCTMICEGQSMDIEFESSDQVGLEEYQHMIELKTAVLFKAAAAVPAIILGADEETVSALGRYGLAVGEGFQIHDDVLDLTVPSEQLGKLRGSDLVEGKRTLITIHAETQGVDIHDIRPTNADDVDAIETAVDALDRAGSIDFARDRARELVDVGTAELEVLPDNESRRLLEDLAYYLVERDY